MLKNFLRNQPLYMQGLCVNFGVGSRNHEKGSGDLNCRFAAVQWNECKNKIVIWS